MCKICIANIAKPHLIKPAFTKILREHSERIQQAVRKGEYDNILVDKPLTQDIAQNLTADAFTAYGYNIVNVEWMGSDYKALTTIEQNLYKFATFKNANYIQELKAIKHLPEKEYQLVAKKISKNYNENYLRAETQYANRAAAQHRRWNDIQRMSDEFMYLQFKTREDARVRYKHTLYNNFTALASDPVWKYLYPPVKYAYGCRCFVLQHFQLPDDAEQDTPKNIPSAISPAVSGVLFDDTHPYIKNAAKVSSPLIEMAERFLQDDIRDEVRNWSKLNPIKTITNTFFKDDVTVSNNDVRTVTGKYLPNDNNHKNRAIYTLQKLFENSVFSNESKEKKDRPKYKHWYYFKISNQEFYINVALMWNDELKLHAITNSIQ